MLSRLGEDTGATSVIVALVMTVVLIVAALVVDVGAMSLRRAQVQDAADAAALAIAQQCYEAAATDELTGCAPEVRASATATIESIAEPTVQHGTAELVGAPVFALHTVTVQLRSTQPAMFSWAAGSSDGTVTVSATAEWRQPAVALPLAVNACNLPAPGPGTVFVGTGLYNDLGNLLGGVTGILTGASLPDYLSNLLGCGTNVLAGGWVGEMFADCSYDPTLLVSTLGMTLNKVLPLNSCQDVIADLVGKRIIVPVYDNATIQGVGTLLGTANVTRFAEIIVTGYDFDGLLGIGSLTYYAPGQSDPGCAADVAELLGLSGVPLIGALLSLLGDLLLNGLLDLLSLCQGVQGVVVHDDLTAEQAAAALIPYRLID